MRHDAVVGDEGESLRADQDATLDGQSERPRELGVGVRQEGYARVGAARSSPPSLFPVVKI